MIERFAQNQLSTTTVPLGTLTSGATATATTLATSAAAPSSLAPGQFRIKIDSELILVISGGDTTTWTVQRGIEGTAAAAHSSAASISYILTGGALTAVAQESIEPSVPYTVFVNQLYGNDSNNSGASPGQALRTIGKAVATLQQAGHGGRVIVQPISGGPLSVTEPMHFVYPIWIEGVTPSSTTLERNFDTPNSRSAWDAVTTATGTSATSVDLNLTSADAGRIITIYGAGVGGGTFYDFITSATPGSGGSPGTANFTAATSVARSVALKDPHGVKVQVVDPGSRVVTDASMVQSGVAPYPLNIVDSPSAPFVPDDVGREVVVAGAGRGGQALRSAVQKFLSNTQVQIVGIASQDPAGAKCAIGVNFGDLVTWHVGQGGLRNAVLRDPEATTASRIGAALKVVCEDGGAGSQLSPSDLAFEHVTLTSQAPNGAWEHLIECDGSWNQNTGGPGARRVAFLDVKVFGSRRPTETIRLASAVHWNFVGEGIVGAAPTSIAQGIAILDPQKTASLQVSSSDVNFTNFEAVGSYYYTEGQYCTFYGGRLAPVQNVTGHRVIELSDVADHCSVNTVNYAQGGSSPDEYDAGTNNRIETNVLRRLQGKADEAMVPSNIAFETFPRRGSSNNSQVIGSSGTVVLQAIWLPGGRSISKVALLGGAQSLAWGTGSGQQFFAGIYDPALNLLGQTSNTGGSQAYSNSWSNCVFTLTSPARVPVGGLCYIALLINSGTGGTGGFIYPNYGGVANGMSVIAPVLCGTFGSGLTTLPGTISSLTPVSSQIYGGAL